MAIAHEHIVEVLRFHFLSKIAKTAPDCPSCGTDNWVILGIQITLPYDGAQVVPDARVTPFVVIACKNCSTSLFLAWNPMESAWIQQQVVPNAQ